jgi:vancomycin resistance protein VanJ
MAKAGSRRGSASSPGCAWRLIDAYGLAMILYLVLWRTTGDRLLPVYLLGFVAHLALPAAFVWLPLTLLRRRWESLVIQTVCAVAFFWLFGDVFVGRNADPPTSGSSQTVTVMPLNLGNGLATPERLVRVLRASDADIVGLQEVTPEVAATLASELSTAYPHQVRHGLGRPGKALLSRFPIVRSELLRLHPDRPDLRATLDVDGVAVTVLVAHPAPPRLGWTDPTRRPGAEAQVAALLDLVETTEGPLLLLSDLNATRMHRFSDRLEEAGLRDAYQVAGDGGGFTAPTRLETLARSDLPLGDLPIPPLLRIDYVWVSAQWRVSDAWVGDSAGSDHLPVLARLTLAPSG